jgi:hypothetical protein
MDGAFLDVTAENIRYANRKAGFEAILRGQAVARYSD